MRTFLQRRVARADLEDGFTLMELLVSMILLGIVGAIVATAASVALKTNAQSEVTVSKTQDAQTALDRLSRGFASAVNPINDSTATPVTYLQGFVATGPFSATYYANVKNLTSNGATLIPQLVTDQVVADPSHTGSYMLTETVTNGSPNPATPATPAYVWTGTPTTRVVAYGVAKPDTSVTAPLFVYNRPTYFNTGTAADIAVGQANCNAATAPAVQTATSGPSIGAWVGAQQNISAASSVSSVKITVTLAGNGTNAPQYASGSKNLAVSTLVQIDSANSYLSRDGTCQ